MEETLKQRVNKMYSEKVELGIIDGEDDRYLDNIREDIPVIVVGDFNLLPDTESIKILNDKLINLIEEYNIKSTRPTFDDGLDVGNLVCDYVFVNDKIVVNDLKVINSNISDHLPIILDFDIK